MKILYINHYAGSPSYGMEFRPYYLACQWSELGHTVRIIAANYSHLRQHNPLFDKPFFSEMIDRIEYIWCKTPPYQSNGIGRAYNIFTFLYRLKCLKKKIVLWNPDWVIASSTYPLDIFFARSIAKLCHAKLIYEVHDLWPLTLIEVGGFSRFHPFIRLLQYAENFAYRNADKVISMLPNAKSYMLQHGMEEKKYHVIPNGIDISEWESCPTKLALQKYIDFNALRNKHQFLLGYVGGHGFVNALDDLLKAASYLSNQSIGLVLIGDGLEKQFLMNQAKRLYLLNVYFYPAIPKNKIPILLAQFDALYLGWKKLSIYRFGINPNKLFDYMMAAKPILHACLPEYDLVKKANCGLSVEAENPKAIADGIDQMKRLDKATRDKIGLIGQRYVCHYHDYQKLAQKFVTHCRK